MWSCEAVMQICTVIIWLLQNGLLDNWSLAPAQVISSGRTPNRTPPVCLVRGLKRGRKGHMKTITVIEK
jgi:hypothetical protein